MRLGEHRERREALGLRQVPHWTTLQKFLARLREGVLQKALAQAATRLLPPRPSPSAPQPVVAADATGLRTSRASLYLVRRLRQLGVEHPRRAWLKHTILVDVHHQVILAQRVSLGPRADIPDLPPLVRQGRRVEPLGVVLADAGFDSEGNHRYIREKMGAMSVIPPKRGRPMKEPRGFRGEMALCFPKEVYRLRALVETVISVIKRKLGDLVAGQSLRMQRKQALLLGLVYNLYRLKWCLFWPPPLWQRLSTPTAL